MNEVTRIVNAAAEGDTQAAEELLPLAYQELRRIAANKMVNEREDHTLQPTALVHEAYLKLLGPEGEGLDWQGREHFFSAAAEAMRRILIDSARRKQTQKRGGDVERTTWNDSKWADTLPADEILAVNDALSKLETLKPALAKIVKLRYFAGLSIAETAATLDVSESSVNRSWRGARAWLKREVSGEG